MGSRVATLAVALMCSVGLFLGMMGGGGSLLTTQLGLIGGAFFLVSKLYRDAKRSPRLHASALS
jgi:hypothetical protein